MRAVTYQGKKKVRVKDVADAILEKKDEILVQITSTAICGSDLHDVHRVKKGDRVIIPFTAGSG